MSSQRFLIGEVITLSGIPQEYPGLALSRVRSWRKARLLDPYWADARDGSGRRVPRVPARRRRAADSRTAPPRASTLGASDGRPQPPRSHRSPLRRPGAG